MSKKTYIKDGEEAPESQIGASLEVLANTIDARRDCGEESYTWRLLNGSVDGVLKKLVEEAGEVALAAKDVEVALAAKDAEVLSINSQDEDSLDAAIDHLRYEAGDVVYHLLVILSRYGISVDELAAELNTRMREDELSVREGMIRLQPEHVKRGK